MSKTKVYGPDISSGASSTVPDRTPPGSISHDASREFLDQHIGTIKSTAVAVMASLEPTALERDDEKNGNGVEREQTAIEYPKPLALALLMVGICLAAFLVALDRTIVATAIPRITDEFHSTEDVGWYGSAYLLTSCAFQPTYGRIFADFDVKWSFVTALGFFELGSLICAVAPSSTVLIVGRAIAGLGCAGVFAGCLVIIAMSSPLEKRPSYMALVGAVFGIGSVAGPLLGGAFTDRASWRLCFWINLPIGAITIVTLLTCFKPAKHADNAAARLRPSLFRRFLALDLVGNLLIITAIIMLLLALEWGGLQYAWDSAQIIGLLVGSGLEYLIFAYWQVRRGDDALVPPSLVKDRTILFASIAGFFISGAFLIHSYYLPYWFQAIRGASAIQGGVDVVPYVVSMFVLSVVAGLIVTKTGYFNPWAIIGPAVACIGCGLLTTLKVDTPMPMAIGFQILAAAGVGMSFQQGLVAVQAVLPADSPLLPIGTAFIIFTQSMSGAIFVSVGNTTLRNALRSGLTVAELPGVNIDAILEAGATDLSRLIPTQQLALVVEIYNQALSRVFLVAIPLSALSALTALGMRFKSIKGVDAGLTA